MRTIIIGDVHGCLEEFHELLKLVSFSKGNDRLIQVGDLMDFGPDPVGCVRFARENDAFVLLGNHEETHIRWRRHMVTHKATGKKIPMRAFDQETAAQNAALTDEEIEWMAGLPLSCVIRPNLVAVHAGLEPKYTFADQSRAVLRVWYVNNEGKMVGYAPGSHDQPPDTLAWAEAWKGPESVVYGHAVHSLESPQIDHFTDGHCYGVDTGCAYGGKLTAMVLNDDLSEPEFAQVAGRVAYRERKGKRL